MCVCEHIYIICMYLCISPDTCSACKFFSSVTTSCPTEHISRRGAGIEGWRGDRDMRTPGDFGPKPRPLQGRSSPGATPARQRAPGGARRAGEAPRRREGETAEGQPGRTPLRTGTLCHAKPPPCSHTPGRSRRALPASAGGHSPSPQREEAERLLRPRSRPPAPATAAPRPPPAFGLAASRRGFGNGWLRGALCGAPQFPLYSALPTSRSLSPLLRQPLVARSTCFLSGSWPALQRATARERRHPVPKPNQKYGMWTRVADLTGDAERSDPFHPFRSSAAAFLSIADIIMLPYCLFK